MTCTHRSVVKTTTFIICVTRILILKGAMKITLLLHAIFPLSAAFTVPVALRHDKRHIAALFSSPESDVGSFSSEIQPSAVDSAVPEQSVISESSKQAEYGVSLEFPDSYAKCGRCQTIYGLTLEDLGDERSKGR